MTLSWYWETEVHCLLLAQPQLLLSLSLSHASSSSHYMGTACRACHTLRDMLSMAAYLACLGNWPRCSNDVVRQAGYTKDWQRQKETQSQREEAYFLRGILIWSSPPSSSFSSFPQIVRRERGWVTKTGERIEAEREWRKRRQIRGMMAPQPYSLSARPTVQCYTAMAQGTD